MRSYQKFAGDDLIEEGHHDFDWSELRVHRDAELKATDHYALSDRTLTDEMKHYREMLRDLPSNFPGDDANEACDHWAVNPRPEE